jgi:hypothetical protein
MREPEGLFVVLRSIVRESICMRTWGDAVIKSLFFLMLIYSLCITSGCASGGGNPPPPPVAATHFSVTPATAPTAGTAFNFTVTALGASGQMATSYTGTVQFASTDPQAVLPASSMLTSVTGTFTATLKTAGSQTITVTDANSLSGISTSITVSPGAATHFTVTGPTAASAGLQFFFTVTAFDAYNNIATNYSGMVHFSSSDGQAVLPPPSALTNGTGTFPATLKMITNATITAADTAATPPITGGSNPIGVVSNAATHFNVIGPGTATTRRPFGVSVTAQDAANNVSAGYSGTLQFTSTDSLAQLPASSPLTNGTGNFSATFENAGPQIITATDTVNTSLIGTSSIAVSAAAAIAITSAAPPSGTFGVTYGPSETEAFKCFSRTNCIPCGRSGCSGLRNCSTHSGYPCFVQRQIFDGFPLIATGGVPPYSWGASPMPPAPGLSVDSQSGEISGIPTSPGSYNVSVTVTDSGTPPATTTPASYSILINDPPPPVINGTPAPPSGAVNLPYSFTFTASSTAPPLMWKIISAGTPPPGTILNPDGVLSGTPTATGTSPFTLVAEDSFKQDSTPQAFTIQIFAHGFKPTGNMAGPRIAHTATLLSTGMVLVAGGTDGSGMPIATAELYDPAKGTFSMTGSMATARAHYASTLLCDLSTPPCNDKRVLVTGGLDINGNPLTSAELYDPSTGTFSPAGSMQFVHASHTATLLTTGKVLIIGWGPATAELFDPVTGTFKTTGSMLAARVSHTATLLKSGKVLVTGGIGEIGGAPGVLAESELYDPATERFSQTLGPLATARQWHTASLLTDGRVLVAGGMLDNAGKATATAELFDPTTQIFTTTKGPLATARDFQTATVLNDGTVLVTGGDDGTGTLSSAEVYDSIAETFSPTGSMATTRESHTATLLNDGTVLATGGAGGGEATAELYQ